MKNKILKTSLFDKRYKKFAKKFPSLENELKDLLKELEKNPKLGTLITDNAYKIRLASIDKNSGKSGGFRIITYLIEQKEQEFTINLLIIYDKSEESSFNKNQIKALIKSLDL